MTTYAVTGASRGLGLGLVRNLLKDAPIDVRVVALARAPAKSDELQKLAEQHAGQLLMIPLDIINENSLKDAAADLEKKLPDGLDVLINNAGVMEEAGLVPPPKLEGSDFSNVLNTNVVGPFLVTKYFLPLLQKGQKKTIVNMSSSLGSLNTVQNGLKGQGMPMDPSYMAYKSSKSALNMGTLTWAHALKDQGFTVISINPGWVQTDMGNQSAEQAGGGAKPQLTVDQSTTGMVSVIKSLTTKDNGTFRNHDKATVPW